MNALRSGTSLQRLVLAILLPAFALLDSPLQANPRGGVVVHGAADIARTSGTHLQINQHSQVAIINWQDFSIGAGEVTRFVQPGGGTALNRVVSGNVSEIHGALRANANVYVINPNGIFIGSSGVVDVGGNAVLSTLDISNRDFLAGGAQRFRGASNTGVTNFGSIESADGDVILMGGFVDNQGQIGALNGTVAIGAGGEIELMQTSSGRLSVRGASTYEGTGINNAGTIEGASVELKAHGNVYALAINNTGMIRASGATRENGRVRLQASGGSSNINLGQTSQIVAETAVGGGSIQVGSAGGAVNVGGSVSAASHLAGGDVEIRGHHVTHMTDATISAAGDTGGGSVLVEAQGNLLVNGSVDASSSAGAGGSVDLSGREVRMGAHSSVSVDGGTSGGDIRVGADFQGRPVEGLRIAESVSAQRGARLSADGAFGDGGSVIVWAEYDTTFFAEVSASALGAIGNGGFIEISGKEELEFDGVVNASSVGGSSGTVLFDPGDVTIGAAGTTITIESINNALQGGTNVLVFTESGNITFDSLGLGGSSIDGNALTQRHFAIQWTNSTASFGAIASGSIFVNNHIRTSGGGSISLLAGWTGSESDVALSFDPQSAWDFYVSQGMFGQGGGSVLVGSASMTRHVEVGSRFGHTNVAGFDVRVRGSDASSIDRYAMIGFSDSGVAFAPRLNNGGGIVLDLIDGVTGEWILSDGRNSLNMPANGTYDPVVAIVGQHEVDRNGDGIVDGVHGIDSSGVRTDTFIPYANHYNSTHAGNWWWQQIEAAGSVGASIMGVVQTADPLGLGGLRPENGAGTQANPAHINVIARGNVVVQAGNGNVQVAAQIGHGGPNNSSWGGAGTSSREVGGSQSPDSTSFSIAGVERGQIERVWSFNGTTSGRAGTSIARLAPVYGNINVYAGVNPASPISINRGAGTVNATVGTGGNVIVNADSGWKTSTVQSNSYAQIGHGGVYQFGEFNGDIHLEAGGSVRVIAGSATRAYAIVGHGSGGGAYWDPTSVADQQLRFFSSVADFDNPNLRYGELFSGVPSTGFDPTIDPSAILRKTLAASTLEGDPGSYTMEPVPGDSGNFVPVVDPDTGELVIHAPTGEIVHRNVHTGETINFSPLLYTRGTSAVDGNSGVSGQLRNSMSPLNLSPTGPIVVEALDGSVIKGAHGNITVLARNGEVRLEAGISPDDPSLLVVTSTASQRDRRFAKIGHGGAEFAVGRDGTGAGYRNAFSGVPSTPNGSTSSGVPGTPSGMQDVRFQIGTSNVSSVADPVTTTGSISNNQPGGSTFNRSPTFMGFTGDIRVLSGADMTLIGGNDVHDYAQIGHGGSEIGDYETSSFILGDIRVDVGGSLLIQGGGIVRNEGREGNTDLRSHAMIGHGGYRSGFMTFNGDIDVNVAGNLTITAGAYSGSMAKIGHQSWSDFGQSGGVFARDEHYRQQSQHEATISSLINEDEALVEYVLFDRFGNPTVITRSFAAGNTSANGGRHTANISVNVGGNLHMNHLQDAQRRNLRHEFLGSVNPDNQAQGMRSYRSYALIGHGGIETRQLNVNNPLGNYGNKIGDISVIVGGSILMENAGEARTIVNPFDPNGPLITVRGGGEDRWTRIGHGVGGTTDRVNGAIAAYSGALELAGKVTVRAGGDIVLNANAADANENPLNSDAQAGSANPSRRNPVVIGHGGVIDALDIVVLGSGELVNGIAADSTISVVSGRDLKLFGGKGVEGSWAQIGHGFGSDQGNDPSRRFNAPTGFTGDIVVNVARHLTLEAGHLAWAETPSDIFGRGQTIAGAFAAIGNGGFMMDRAPAHGDITIYVGGDMNVLAQQRTQGGTRTGDGPYFVSNQDPDPAAQDYVAGIFNFAKVGHVNAENGNRANGTGDAVRAADQSGDIRLVVARDLTVQGGTTPSMNQQPIYGSFAQIGHGGPSIGGDTFGDITVLVGRNLSVAGGTDNSGSAVSINPNNYAMIGNGDWIFNAVGGANALFRTGATGNRGGDINLVVGQTAIFNRALVGHADPLLRINNSAFANRIIFGDTRIGVSRNNPFFGGTGRLVATNRSVFTSGFYGAGSQLEFYMPARSNNGVDADTRLNEASATFVRPPGNFQGPFNPEDGIYAGRADEVYLTPDFWWDNTGRAAAAGFSGGDGFPSNADGSMGGSLAYVESPGGLIHLVELTPGVLGGSAPVYRGGNGVSGAGYYTFYFDAVEFVVNELPPIPGLPPLPDAPPLIFDFGGFDFLAQFDFFMRYRGLFDDEIGASPYGLYDLLGLEEEAEEEEERRRRALEGGAMGSTFYVYDPTTNRYSSYVVFGQPRTSLELIP